MSIPPALSPLLFPFCSVFDKLCKPTTPKITRLAVSPPVYSLCAKLTSYWFSVDRHEGSILSTTSTNCSYSFMEIWANQANKWLWLHLVSLSDWIHVFLLLLQYSKASVFSKHMFVLMTLPFSPHVDQSHFLFLLCHQVWRAASSCLRRSSRSCVEKVPSGWRSRNRRLSKRQRTGENRWGGPTCLQLVLHLSDEY